MFGHIPKSELTVVAPDGSARSVENGTLDSNLAIIPNKDAVIQVGDEIRRKLPNGIEETFEVIDPVFYQGLHGIPPHYQVKIRRKGSFPAGTGGHFTFNVSGPNARVNFGSHDQSQNIAADHSVFGDLRAAISDNLSDLEERSRLKALIEAMEANANDKRSFLSAYQNFIASAANHMTVIAPFLPALTKFMG